MAKTIECGICSSPSVSFSRAVVLSRHEVEYFRCPTCGFVQTEQPHWLKEAYSEAISVKDVGLVSRNLLLSTVTESVVRTVFPRARTFVDYAGGYGLFVRLMRDRGFDFRHHDMYCQNLFAKGFETTESARYDLATAFEVAEHLPSPRTGFAEILQYSDTVLFTTLLLPARVPKPTEWWYYALDTGQHVSFYTLRSLELLAEHLDRHLTSDGQRLHLLSPNRVSPTLFRWVSRARAATLLNKLRPRRPPIRDDLRSGDVSPHT